MALVQISDDKQFDSIYDAILEAQSDDTIYLLQDIVIEDKIIIDKHIDKLDLNYHQLTICIDQGITVKSGGYLNIVDGQIVGESDEILTCTGKDSKLILSNLNIFSNSSTLYSYSKGSIKLENKCTIESEGSYPVCFVTGKDSNIIIGEGCKLSSVNQPILAIKSGAEAYVNGSLETECSYENNSSACIYIHGDNACLHVQNKSYLHSKNTSVLSAAGGSSCIIDGGYLISDSESQPAVIIQNANTIVEMKSGNIRSTCNSGVVSCQLKDGSINTFSMKDGLLDAFDSLIETQGAGDHHVLIEGGIFSKRLQDDYVKDGYDIIKNDDGTWSLHIHEDNIVEAVIELPTCKNDPQCITSVENRNATIVLNRSIPLYASPSRKLRSSDISGVINIIKDGYTDNMMADSFTYVKFKLPGRGGYGHGYVADIDLTEAMKKI